MHSQALFDAIELLRGKEVGEAHKDEIQSISQFSWLKWKWCRHNSCSISIRKHCQKDQAQQCIEYRLALRNRLVHTRSHPFHQRCALSFKVVNTHNYCTGPAWAQQLLLSLGSTFLCLNRIFQLTLQLSEVNQAEPHGTICCPCHSLALSTAPGWRQHFGHWCWPHSLPEYDVHGEILLRGLRPWSLSESNFGNANISLRCI